MGMQKLANQHFKRCKSITVPVMRKYRLMIIPCEGLKCQIDGLGWVPWEEGGHVVILPKILGNLAQFVIPRAFSRIINFSIWALVACTTSEAVTLWRSIPPVPCITVSLGHNIPLG